MKQSLRAAIRIFNFYEQVLIYAGLICFKLKRKAPARATALLQSCNNYVRLIEQGVSFMSKGNNLVKASLFINQQPVSVFLRKNSSDLQVFESVIQHEEYKIVTELLKTTENTSDTVIVDAGGNIGLTTVYLHTFYPKAMFLVVEPDINNFTLLKMNLQENKITNTKLFNNALWISNEKLIINNSFRDGKDWSLTVEKANGSTSANQDNFLKGISLEEICTSSAITKIDLFKIDIEGAERFLFINKKFLENIKNRVLNLAIEIHDEFEIRGTIDKEMANLGFQKEEMADITLYSKI